MNISRRKFVRQTSYGAAGMMFSRRALGSPDPSAILSGIQISPPNILDEGLERCLDFIQDTAAIDTLFCYSQTYHMGARPLNVLATDHPQPPRAHGGRDLPFLWMKLASKDFAGLSVQHETVGAEQEYARRDLFAELVEPCQKRGMKVYARILEAGMRRADRIPGYRSVTAIDIDGDPSHGPCWNHPEYREWIRVTIEQMMRRYPLDGLQYGAERVGPLSEVLFRGTKPACFCGHCVSRNEKAGIDSQRAKLGYRELFRLIQALEAGSATPVDGVFTSLLRVILRYPEVLSWNQQWFEADQEIQTMVYRTAKAIRPEAEVGQHVDHQRSSWDVFYRAAISYRSMAEHNDFIKPILYHDILGPRLQEWVIDRVHARVLGDLSKGLALDLFYALFGHDAQEEPDYGSLASKGLSPEYVFRETKRCVVGASGKAKVYTGIGIDVPTYVPGGMKPFPSDPATTYKATRRAIDAGASGVVASREYDEMTRPNLRAFGRAVQESRKG